MKMTLLGSGVRTPFVLRGLASAQNDLGLDEVVLHDTDQERLELMTKLGAHLCEEWGAKFTLTAETDPRAAIADARFVFSAIRAGQEHARTIDEELPLTHGVLGQETTGPGGFAMALRTIPAMLEYARLIEEVAPNRLLGELHQSCGDRDAGFDRPHVGLEPSNCDGPISMQGSVAQFLGVPADKCTPTTSA